MSVLCSAAALALVFTGLLELDRPLRQYTRSLHVVWLARAGDLLHYSGVALIVMSVLVLAIGFVRRRPLLRRVGTETLIAHVAVGLAAQTLKHLIGRPRPRLLREDEFLTGPSLVSGLDSFPSGHASASFAVAAVLATRFPRWAGLTYGVAGLVTVARVVRGSHFATDVMAGVVLGMLVGSVVANPRRAWRDSLAGALTSLGPYMAGGFAILSTLCQPVFSDERTTIMLWIGSAVIALGVGSRWASAVRGRPSRLLPLATPAIGMGLALTTGFWLVVLVVGLVILARWPAGIDAEPARPIRSDSRAVLAESALAVLLLVTVLSLHGMRGMLLLPG